MNGQISIVRPGACDDREIRLIIRLAMGKTITALITPENLALALTGKSDLLDWPPESPDNQYHLNK
ncbi:hypothetical protein [Escherichia coli]|uniref:hypothetical protein n=1 Tax=Escherichia coli TaxID=562 RepID=UPI001E32A4D3|nr:hypothetical protein [Escherichia coli]